MKRETLKVEKRSVLGKKVKQLRKQGVFPANIYGKGITSVAVQVPFADFEKVYKEAGETGLVDIIVGSETRPVLIHNVQKDYQTKVPLHADFYQVNLKEKVKTMVPLEIIGEPKAIADKLGILMQTLNEVEVEALPADLPEKIEVNVEYLAAVDDQILVSDLKAPTGVTVLTDGGQVIAKIAELVSKEAEEQAAADAAAAEAAKAEGAEAGLEGVEKTEETKAEEGGAASAKSSGPLRSEASEPKEEKKEEKPQ